MGEDLLGKNPQLGAERSAWGVPDLHFRFAEQAPAGLCRRYPAGNLPVLGVGQIRTARRTF